MLSSHVSQLLTANRHMYSLQTVLGDEASLQAMRTPPFKDGSAPMANIIRLSANLFPRVPPSFRRQMESGICGELTTLRHMSVNILEFYLLQSSFALFQHSHSNLRQAYHRSMDECSSLRRSYCLIYGRPRKYPRCQCEGGGWIGLYVQGSLHRRERAVYGISCGKFGDIEDRSKEV